MFIVISELELRYHDTIIVGVVCANDNILKKKSCHLKLRGSGGLYLFKASITYCIVTGETYQKSTSYSWCFYGTADFAYYNHRQP